MGQGVGRGASEGSDGTPGGRLAGGDRAHERVEAPPQSQRSLVGGPSVAWTASSSPRQTIRLRVAEHPDVLAPRNEIRVVVKSVLIRFPGGRTRLGVDEVEGEVAADDPHALDVVWCFHQSTY